MKTDASLHKRITFWTNNVADQFSGLAVSQQKWFATHTRDLA